MKALCNRTHSTDTVDSRSTAGSTRKDNTHNSLPGTRTQFRPTHQHQNAAPKRKRIHLPPVQSREVFSNSFILPPNNLTRGTTRSFSLYSGGVIFGISYNADVLSNQLVGDVIKTHRIRSGIGSAAGKCNYRSPRQNRSQVKLHLVNQTRIQRLTKHLATP